MTRAESEGYLNRGEETVKKTESLDGNQERVEFQMPSDPQEDRKEHTLSLAIWAFLLRAVSVGWKGHLATAGRIKECDACIHVNALGLNGHQGMANRCRSVHSCHALGILDGDDVIFRTGKQLLAKIFLHFTQWLPSLLMQPVLAFVVQGVLQPPSHVLAFSPRE